ncbi:MAG TPA: hypothetical protein VKZ18_06255 [Polyangia bacterium]|nr:hypothetical protein [Polyangia bacterium]
MLGLSRRAAGLVFAGSLLAGGALALWVRHPKPAVTRAPPRVEADCIVQGKRYHSGEALPSFDHCNAFVCRDGSVEGTVMGCEPKRPAHAK